MRLLIVGDGKMGRAVAELAAARGHDITIVGRKETTRGRGLAVERIREHDVALEFTRPDAAPANIERLIAAGVPVVTGTTGWDAELPRITALVQSRGGALLYGANFSIGGSFIWKKGGDLVGRIRPYAVYTPLNWTYTDRNGQSRTVTLQSQNNTDAVGNTQRYINQPKFHQEYKGFVIQANKRMSNKWMMLGSLTVSKSEGLNAGSASRDPSSQQRSNQDPFGRDPNDFITPTMAC
jgi:hypothetical protein